MTLHSRHPVGNYALRSIPLALCWLTGGALLFCGEGRPVQRTPVGQHSLAAATPLIGAGHGSPTAQARVAASYYQTPLSFERNQGQTDSRVKFLSRGHGYGLFLTGEEAVLSLRKPSASSDPRVEIRNSKLENRNSARQTRGPSPESRVPSVLRLRLAGANPAAKVVGLDELPGTSNYFLGNDPRKWRTNVPNYGKVKYEGVYPGIDLVYYGNQRQLEYDFVVAPGADPRAIRLAIEAWDRKSKLETRKSKLGPPDPSPESRVASPERVRIDPNGDLVIAADGGEVRFRKPVIYQEQSTVDSRESRTTINEANPKSKIQNRKSVEGAYKLLAGNQVRFEIAAYDRSRPLVIDPVLSYATFLGGAGSDYATAIAVDSDENVYVAGHTASTDFPKVSALYDTLNGPGDVFVTKMKADGTPPIYSTYLGGSYDDYGSGIAVDSTGNAYVTGYTYSTNFPTTPGAFQETAGGSADVSDAFVTKLNPLGSALVYSSYLGGTSSDEAYGIALDSVRSAYIVGSTQSTNFPTTNPMQGSNAGLEDAFVTKVRFDGGAKVYSTYLGGSGFDYGYGIAVDSGGNVYVTGSTDSPTDFPTTNPFQDANGGTTNAFITKLDGGGGRVYSTYLGGSDADYGTAIAVDSTYNAYVVGNVTSLSFPLVNLFQPGPGGGQDIFVSKIKADGSGQDYTVILGGSGTDSVVAGGAGVAVDANGSVYVTGYTDSSDYPLASPVQGSWCGGLCGSETVIPCPDVVVSKINPAGNALIFSTYLGGNSADAGYGLALDWDRSAINAYVAGSTASGADFPATADAYQPTCGGGGLVPCDDAVVAKFTDLALPVFFANPTSLDFGSVGVGFTSTKPVTVENRGDGNLFISGFAGSSGFAATQGAGQPCYGLAPNTTCTIEVTFTPSALGSFSGSLTISDNAYLSPHVVALSGTGIAPPVGVVVTLAPTALTFGSQLVGTTSAAKTVQYGLLTGTVLNVASIVTNGDFAQTNDCPSSISPGSSCTISVTFSPSSPGSRGGTLTITDDGPYSPRVVPLSGTGATLPTRPLVAFTAKTDFATASGPVGVAAGDFNGDGKLDLATSGFASTASILLGNGDGTFGAHVDYAAGGRSRSVAAGDFNRDGKLDLAVANIEAGTLSILLGNGDGTFGAPVSVGGTLSSAPWCVTAADLNQDGKLDLAIAQPGSLGGGIVSILLGNGDGTFQPRVDYAAGFGAVFVAVGDFNGDGKLDLATADSTPGTVSILLGNGDGTFPSHVEYAAGTSPWGVAVADFNGDGNQDLAVTNPGSNTISIFLGKGDGTFQPKVDYAGKSAPHLVASQDLNGDGRLDLIFSENASNVVSVLLGNGDGTFQSRLDFPTGASPFGVVPADFNGDGRPDLAVADGGSNAVSILLNMPLYFSPTSLDFGSQVVGESATQTITLTNIGDTSLTTSFATSGDFAVTAQTNPCGASLAAGAICNLDITFTPSAGGARPGSATVTFSGAGSPQTISLSGTGTSAPAVTLTPLAGVSFAGNPLNLDCPSKPVTLTNTGSASLVITGISMTPVAFFVDPDPAHTTCSASLALQPQANCIIGVKFHPTEVGAWTGTLTVTTSPPVTSGNTVSLSGNGLPECHLLAQVRSATVLRGTEAADFEIADSKPSCSPVNLNLTCTPDNPAQCALNPAVIPPSGTSRLTVGNLRAVAVDAVRVVVNSVSEFRAASEAVNVLLSDFAFTRAPDAASVRAGETASYAPTNRPINGLAGPVALACNGAPRAASCTLTPAAVTLDGASLVPVKLQVATTARAAAPGARFHWPPLGRKPGLFLLVGLAMLVVAASRRRVISPVGTPALKSVLLLAALLLMLLWAACGGGGSLSWTSRGTPAGTYSLKVTGTYTNSSGSTPSSLTNSTSVTLQVN
ncbi:MAG: choice-of-anchor D domain-containing protein [Acidobacteriia bacterium]|nr:choice-of-anchor D domain-containing protein [Terriglobia bacterium]